ncbi:HlyD family secretion protein [Bacteroides caecimuris]|uniref:HlyD family secretion protein n=1 Tax=Bacteroides caecimuris TaxID=1796613 RepID=UPI001C3D030B|nr:HlyD family efflux transporter periplasmic adaptor subunit [Bacteroides caecimuris]
MDQDKINEIELNSEEFQEILAKTPPWILRCGITLVLIIMILFLIGASLFRYPDVIQAPIRLTGTIPAARIKAKTSGILTDIYVSNNQIVKEGEYLAVIQNSADMEDMKYIKVYLNNYLNNSDTVAELPDKELKLGTLQSFYSAFYQALFDYKKYKEYKYGENKMSTIKEQSKSLRDYSINLQRQRNIMSEQMDLTAKGFVRDSILYRKGLISLESFEQSRRSFLSGKLDLENINSALNNVNVQMEQLKESLLDSENTFRETENNYIVSINNLVTQLLAEIQAWEINFVLVAPVNGKLSFNNYWSKNQNVISGEEIFNIIPEDNGVILAKAYVPVTRSGKIKIGQRVNIRLENFPDTEFGVIKGKVENISKVPSISSTGEYYYTAEIALPNGLTTSYRKKLPYYPEMSGLAEIVTNDLSLLERIFLPIRKVLTDGFNL